MIAVASVPQRFQSNSKIMTGPTMVGLINARPRKIPLRTCLAGPSHAIARVISASGMR